MPGSSLPRRYHQPTGSKPDRYSRRGNVEVTTSWFTSLINALKNRFGRGPSGCVVFRNGDSACIQINILAPGAWLVLEGTAMDIDGNPIAVPSYDTIRNGVGLGLTIRQGPPSLGTTGWTPVGGSMAGLWLVCVSTNGVIDYCYVSTVQP